MKQNYVCSIHNASFMSFFCVWELLAGSFAGLFTWFLFCVVLVMQWLRSMLNMLMPKLYRCLTETLCWVSALTDLPQGKVWPKYNCEVFCWDRKFPLFWIFISLFLTEGERPTKGGCEVVIKPIKSFLFMNFTSNSQWILPQTWRAYICILGLFINCILYSALML